MMFPSRSRALIHALVLFMAILEVKSFVHYKSLAVPSAFQLDVVYRKGKGSARIARPRVHRGRLHRVIKSIEYYGQVEGDERRASDVLLNAMRMLLDATTQDKISHVGNLLNTIDIVNGECRPIQERVVTATSIAGLVSISINILTNMLQSSYLPSSKAYVAACSALRQSGRFEDLERFVYDLAEIGTKLDTAIDVVAWNIYLSSLCSSIDNPEDPTLARVWEWMDPNVARREFRVTPDVTSFNILLGGAARVGNKTLVESVWQDLESQIGLEPDIVSYNARLKASFGPEHFDILEEIERVDISPDGYTIDLLSNDLIGAGRFEDLQRLVDQFLVGKSERAKSNALAAFLVTLVQQENIESARNLFERCTLDNPTASSVSPCTRHFNILLDGYSKIAKLSTSKDQLLSIQESLKNSSSTINNLNLDTSKAAALAEGRKLCRKIVSLGVEQDPYTLSSMISLCISSTEIIELMNESTAPLSPPVIRSAITYLGRLGDPSQACRVFDQFAFESNNNRVWNVLLGALSEGAKQGNIVLDMKSAVSCKRSVREGKGISSLVDGLTCADAARTLLSTMNGMRDGLKAPKPNSQSYCLVASALQVESADPSIAMDLFRNATSDGIPADGRFVNALLRCFGGNIEEALKSWKEEIRIACVEYESRARSGAVPNSRRPKKNLIAAYNGLLHVCGRAIRPDIALRVSYAMNKEGLEPNEISLNSYKAGKRHQEKLSGQNDDDDTWGGSWLNFLPKPNMIEQYESLLYIECTRYNPENKRMSKERRVRIIL
mmetsp:Transcript_3708/g.8552  ORF Transcript_3708/g.8552 Transcript_3708/m.8552 type:complete len:781 (-) Transcript_3708:306-2648(-)